MPPSDTFFSEPSHWHWLVILYFFFGGIAGGSYFLAALVDLFGDEEDRPLARLGYYVAFPAILLCAPLLILDLNRPERFWHLMIQSERFPLPMFKYWSPMSVGSWALLVFGAFSLLSFLASLSAAGRLPFAPLKALRHGPMKLLIAVIGGLAAFFLASYTGVLLSVTNRPIWSDTNLLGLLFITSAASTAAALLILLARRRREVPPESVSWLKRLDTWVMVLELVVLVALVISLGPVATAWLNVWGLLLVVGVILVGILLPLAIHWRPRFLGSLSIPAASVLVLIGGLVLRAVIVLSSEGMESWTALR